MLGCLGSWPIISLLSRKYLKDTTLCCPCWFMLHQFVNEDMMRDNIERFTEVQINIHCSPFIHQASNFLSENYKFGQARFPLFKSMMTSLRHILILPMRGNGFQTYLFYDLSMDWGKVDLLVGPPIILFVFLEDRRDTCLLSFIFHSSRTSLKYHDLHYFSWNCRIQL